MGSCYAVMFSRTCVVKPSAVISIGFCRSYSAQDDGKAWSIERVTSVIIVHAQSPERQPTKRKFTNKDHGNKDMDLEWCINY